MAEKQTASILFFFQPKRRNQDVEDDGLNNAANSSDNNHESDGQCGFWRPSASGCCKLAGASLSAINVDANTADSDHAPPSEKRI